MNAIIGTVGSAFASVGNASPAGPASPNRTGDGGMGTPVTASGEALDQGKALEEAMNVVKVQAFHMRKALVRFIRPARRGSDASAESCLPSLTRLDSRSIVVPGPKQAHGRAETLLDDAGGIKNIFADAKILL
jgi:hypothetical protein